MKTFLLFAMCFLGIRANSDLCSQVNCMCLEKDLEKELKKDIPPNMQSRAVCHQFGKYLSNAHNISRALYPRGKSPAKFIGIKVKFYNTKSNQTRVENYIWTLSCIYAVLPRDVLAAVSLGTLYHEREVLELTVPEFCEDVPGKEYMKYALSSTGNTTLNRAPSAASITTARPQTQGRLPSRYQSIPSSSTSSPCSTTKRRTTGSVGRTKTWSKDVVCIPGVNEEWSGPTPAYYSIPRGPARAKLTDDGLVGKVRIVSTWTPIQVVIEITSVFGKQFVVGENGLLDYDYLSIVPGTKRLKTPSVSTSFTWNGQEVASLAGQGCLYIVAKSKLIKTEELPLEAMKAYPTEFKKLFCFQATELTATMLQELFCTDYSPTGSNHRPKEELIVMHWRDFLQECEAEEAIVSLQQILIFATGADVIPPCGFEPTPMARFWADVRPRGDTCANTIRLPTWPNKENVSFEEFKELMEDGILNSPGFGRS